MFKLLLKRKRRPQGKKTAKRLNASKLKCDVVANKLSKDMDNKLIHLHFGSAKPEEEWANFRDIVHSTALEHLGSTQYRHQDWFDENDDEIKVMLEEKNKLHKAYENDPFAAHKKAAFTNSRRTIQAKLRIMQDTWRSKKAHEIQSFADSHESKRFYEALRSVYGPQTSGSSPLLSSDSSKLLTEKTEILDRWAEHFNSVLNRPADINEVAIDRLPQVEIDETLDRLPDKAELQKAIKQLSCGKALAQMQFLQKFTSQVVQPSLGS